MYFCHDTFSKYTIGISFHVVCYYRRWKKTSTVTISEEDILYDFIFYNEVFLLPRKTIKHYSLNRPLDSLIYNQYSEKVNYVLQIALNFYLHIEKTLVKPEVKELLISYGKIDKPQVLDR